MSAEPECLDLGLIVPVGGRRTVGLLGVPPVWLRDVVAAGGVPRVLENEAALRDLAAGALDVLVLGEASALPPRLLRAASAGLTPGGVLVAVVRTGAARRFTAALQAAGLLRLAVFAAEPAGAPYAIVSGEAIGTHLSTPRPLHSRRDVALRLLAPLLAALPGTVKGGPPSRLVVARRAP